MTDTARFYADLPAAPDFAAVADFAAYAPAPDDWTVLHTDIVDSSRAIAGGRYKDVNLIGAAGITAALNAASDFAIPFVFGGDGASLLVPPQALAPARAALIGLAALARARFDLALRVAEVPLTTVRALGGEIGVRKLELSPGNDLALFSGGGLELVDWLAKDPAPDNPYRLPQPAEPPPPDLAGLSCRWEPLRAANGVSLTLLVRAAAPDAQAQATVLRQSLDAVETILRDGGRAAAPVRPETMRFRFPPRWLWEEAKATAGRGSTMLRAAQIALISAIFAVGKALKARIGGVDIPAYLEQTQINTDFRKYDGLLRLVLDVTPAQADAIEAHLAREYAAGRLVYGTHRADASLMTCLVFRLEAGQHMHFIDGADGGFALAAQAFKARLTSDLADSAAERLPDPCPVQPPNPTSAIS
ncbi:MAG: DUF3095 family protein [Alphaproteobacteria bacterium]|nr:DUF3095 family protein [Alphaproteobacteria bacterium]